MLLGKFRGNQSTSGTILILKLLPQNTTMDRSTPKREAESTTRMSIMNPKKKRETRATNRSTNSTRATKAITTKKATNMAMKSLEDTRKRNTMRAAIMENITTERRERKKQSSRKRASIKRDTVLRANTIFSKKMNMRKNTISTTSSMRMEAMKRLVAITNIMKDTKADITKRDIMTLNIIRIIMARKKNTRRVIITLTRKLTKRITDTTIITNTRKSTAKKKAQKLERNGLSRKVEKKDNRQKLVTEDLQIFNVMLINYEVTLTFFERFLGLMFLSSNILYYSNLTFYHTFKLI